jgi:pyruvate,water dikinase
VTVCCSEGSEGRVYDGAVPFIRESIDISCLVDQNKLPTQIHVTLSNPQKALALSGLPCGGVGLVRLEFTIASIIRVHPMALLQYQTLPNEKVKQEIDVLTPQYAAENKAAYFRDLLASSIGLIAAAFFPRPVILRFSDFKTNEYRSLLGGEMFEPLEENPMIGWRGASRYYHPNYKAAFALECDAIKRVRDVWVRHHFFTLTLAA